jgi:hypothetical protein
VYKQATQSKPPNNTMEEVVHSEGYGTYSCKSGSYTMFSAVDTKRKMAPGDTYSALFNQCEEYNITTDGFARMIINDSYEYNFDLKPWHMGYLSDISLVMFSHNDNGFILTRSGDIHMHIDHLFYISRARLSGTSMLLSRNICHDALLSNYHYDYKNIVI